MQIQINIDDTLKPAWRERIQRQLDFKLSSIYQELDRLDVNVYRVEGASGDSSRHYLCRIQASLSNGRVLNAHVQSTSPNICVADACARLRRSINRDRALGKQRSTHLEQRLPG